ASGERRDLPLAFADVDESLGSPLLFLVRERIRALWVLGFRVSGGELVGERGHGQVSSGSGIDTRRMRKEPASRGFARWVDADGIGVQNRNAGARDHRLIS